MCVHTQNKENMGSISPEERKLEEGMSLEEVGTGSGADPWGF